MSEFDISDNLKSDAADFVENLAEEMQESTDHAEEALQGKKVHFIWIVLVYSIFPAAYFLPKIAGLIAVIAALIIGYHWFFSKNKAESNYRFVQSVRINGAIIVGLSLIAAFLFKYLT